VFGVRCRPVCNPAARDGLSDELRRADPRLPRCDVCHPPRVGTIGSEPREPAPRTKSAPSADRTSAAVPGLPGNSRGRGRCILLGEAADAAALVVLGAAPRRVTPPSAVAARGLAPCPVGLVHEAGVEGPPRGGWLAGFRRASATRFAILRSASSLSATCRLIRAFSFRKCFRSDFGKRFFAMVVPSILHVFPS
jgi:hypothetical protein